MDRRTFVKTGIAVAAAASIPAAHAATMMPVVFFDPRYSDSRRFAEALVALGATPISTEVDLVHLWSTRFASATPLRLAGLTPHSDRLIIERCARDARLRMRAEIFHDCRNATTVTHVLHQCGEDLTLALDTSGTDWPAAVAHSLAYPVDAARRSPVRLATRAARAPDHPGTLVSWLIA